MTLKTILATLPGQLQVALLFSAFYFLAALLTGVWKWRAMLKSEDGQAHKYIDIAHHAALHYGPFILLAGILASLWPWESIFPAWILVEIMGWTMVLSLSRYIFLGLGATTTNQLYKPKQGARLGLVFFFFGSVLPGTSIAAGAIIGLWSTVPGNPF